MSYADEFTEVFTFKELIKEVEREIALRESLYPKLLRSGRMEASEAEKRIKRMRAILRVLKAEEGSM